MVDDHTQTNSVGCVVGVCGSVHCKTCVHNMSKGNTFMSNVIRKCYTVINHEQCN